MKIKLSEIPAEGRHYHFDRASGELNTVLADLLENRPYDVEFTIRPLGNAFEIKGNVKAKVMELCSRCGWDIELPIEEKINEILIEDEEEYRKAQSVHGNQSVDYFAEGPAVSYYDHDVFDAGEFIHEAIAISEPFYPTCGDDKCEHLKEVEQKRAELEAAFKKADEKVVGHPGFAALKNLPVGKGGSGELPS